VNFGASKLTVYGNATIKELEKAGAFENLKIIPEKEQFDQPKEPFLKRYANVIVSFLLLMIGWFGGQQAGEDSLASILSYGASILIGGYSLLKTGIMNIFILRFEMKSLGSSCLP
jgi:Zn2+/Cd2+-exporting ATPase